MKLWVELVDTGELKTEVVVEAEVEVFVEVLVKLEGRFEVW